MKSVVSDGSNECKFHGLNAGQAAAQTRWVVESRL